MNPHETKQPARDLNLQISIDMPAFRASITDRDREELGAIAEQLRAAGIEPTFEAILAHPAASDVKVRWESRLRRFTRIKQLA